MSVTQRELEPCTSAEDYLTLFADCFPETHGKPVATGEHYAWKYSAEGKARPCFEYGAYEDGRMVGYYAALPFHYRVSGQSVLGSMVCDVMTHSSMRGRGIFTQQGKFATGEMKTAGSALCLGFPIRAYVIPGHLKVGWKVAFDLPVYFKLLDPTPMLQSRNYGWLAGPAKAVTRGYGAVCNLTRSRITGGTCQRLDLATFAASADCASFLQAWSSHYECALLRTPEMLRWRLSAPYATYIGIGVYEAQKLTAIALLRRTEQQGFSSLGIVDLLALPGADLSSLHSGIEGVAREMRVSGIAMMCTSSDAGRLALRRNAFFRSPVVFKLILKWMGEEPAPPGLWREPAWHLTWFDTDTI